MGYVGYDSGTGMSRLSVVWLSLATIVWTFLSRLPLNPEVPKKSMLCSIDTSSHRSEIFQRSTQYQMILQAISTKLYLRSMVGIMEICATGTKEIKSFGKSFQPCNFLLCMLECIYISIPLIPTSARCLICSLVRFCSPGWAKTGMPPIPSIALIASSAL